jgi:hypothetical protein
VIASAVTNRGGSEKRIVILLITTPPATPTVWIASQPQKRCASAATSLENFDFSPNPTQNYLRLFP